MAALVAERTVVTPPGATPFEVGRCHGAALRAEATRLARRQSEEFLGAGGEAAAALFVVPFEAAMREHTPWLLEEARGISEGAGLSYASALCLQLLDELWEEKQRGGGGLGCTVLSLTAASGARATGQTMDLEGWRDGSQAVLAIAGSDPRPPVLVATSAGCVGLCGANSAGVACCVNNLWQLPSQSAGLPVAAVVRGILACCSFADAAAFVRAVPHASGQAYAISGSGGEQAVFETCAAAVVQVPGGPRVNGLELAVHANHVEQCAERGDIALALSAEALARRERNSRSRRERCAQLLRGHAEAAAEGAAGADLLAIATDALSDEAAEDPICRRVVGDAPATFLSLVVVSGDGAESAVPRVHVAFVAGGAFAECAFAAE